MASQEIAVFKSGVHNLFNSEVIPQDASQDAQNWYTQDGAIKLSYGKEVVGANGTVGQVQGQIFGYRADGTQVHWRKIGTKIQYLNGTTWTDVVTGLTSTADYAFTNYSSLAGTFTYAFGVDGIYKFHNANPASYNSMYDSTKNFKGLAFIDKGRTFLWNVVNDRTGLYGSKIDPQSSAVYTTVTGEATTSLTGTLAFKAGGATRNCFGIRLTLTGTGEVYTDNLNGTLTGSLGGTGTINYLTGAYTVSNAGVGTVNYQWEDSNNGGVTDFRKSSPRVAGEGFVVPQDEGGDPILNVLIGQDGYYSMKSTSAYRLSIDTDDLAITNEVYRKDIGVPTYRASVSTGKGTVFMNTANPEKPEMTILVRNITGDSIEPQSLFSHFKFSNYTYDDCTVDTYERYVLVACKSAGAVNNDTILLCDVGGSTVDITKFAGRTFAKSGGYLYMGSSVSQTVFNLYNGFDDEGTTIDNFYRTKDELFSTNKLKKYRKIRLKGNINNNQSYQVYVNYDNGGDQLVGTVLGTGSYVDYSSAQTIGSSMIGTQQIGGDDVTNVYPYFMEIKLRKVPKFRRRNIKFVALGYGYVDINYIQDWDIDTYEDKLPSAYREKQNVSIDGSQSDLPNPQY